MEYVKHIFHSGSEMAARMQGMGLAADRERLKADGSNCAVCHEPRERCWSLNEARPEPVSMYG